MKTKGFTLIELSIVLVIIGLIVGGVLVGRDLIAAAVLRKVVAQAEQIKTAISTFEAKYNCEPGDCKNGSALGLEYDGPGIGEFNTIFSWQHLRAAKLINCACKGSTGNLDANNDYLNGANVMYWPAMAIGTGFFDVFSGTYTTHSADPAGPTVYRPRTLALANSAYNYSGLPTFLPPFTPLQAFRIDSMIDDGLIDSGRVKGGEVRNDRYSTLDWGQTMVTLGNCDVATHNYKSTDNSTRACELDMTF